MARRRAVKRTAGGAAALGGGLSLVPQVMMMRLPLMAAEAGGSNILRPETSLAMTEKAASIAEGAFAAQMALVHAAFRFWPELLSGRVPSLVDGSAARLSAEAALKPASQRVKANFRRLSRSG